MPTRNRGRLRRPQRGPDAGVGQSADHSRLSDDVWWRFGVGPPVLTIARVGPGLGERALGPAPDVLMKYQGIRWRR